MVLWWRLKMSAEMSKRQTSSKMQQQYNIMARVSITHSQLTPYNKILIILRRSTSIFYPWTFSPSTLWSSSRTMLLAIYLVKNISMHGPTSGTKNSDISPTPPRIFTRSEKVRNLPWFSTSVAFGDAWIRNGASVWNPKRALERRWWAYVRPKFGLV